MFFTSVSPVNVRKFVLLLFYKNLKFLELTKSMSMGVDRSQVILNTVTFSGTVNLSPK